jgi:NADH-quinone oxidoreductase subunit H
MVLSLVPPAMMAGTLSLGGIVDAQGNGPLGLFWWYGMLLPLALIIFFICGLAETNRNPFDLPEAENEIVAGYLTEYSGIRWAMFFMAEYGNMIVSSALASILFLGGWNGPFFIPGLEWLMGAGYMLIKTYAIIFLFLWVRATLPRLRVDQLMAFAWKVLIPLALVNIFLTGLAVTIFPGGYEIPLAIFNWLITIAFLWNLRPMMRRTFARVEEQRAMSTVSVQSQGSGRLADAVRR